MKIRIDKDEYDNRCDYLRDIGYVNSLKYRFFGHLPKDFGTISLKDKIINTPGFIDHEANPPYTDDVRPTGEKLDIKGFVPFAYGVIIGIGICSIIF